MAESHYGEGVSGTQHNRGTNAANHVMAQEALSGPSEGEPCGACKYLRRKCRGRCIFAPHFGTDQGSAKIAAVHKVFGANNVLNLLSYIPPNFRHEAATTISYEARARLSDPVYGCVSTVLALQQQGRMTCEFNDRLDRPTGCRGRHTGSELVPTYRVRGDQVGYPAGVGLESFPAVFNDRMMAYRVRAVQ